MVCPHFASLRCMTSGLKWIQTYGFRDIKMHNVRVYHLQVKDGYILGKRDVKHSPQKLACRPKKYGWKGCWKTIFTKD